MDTLFKAFSGLFIVLVLTVTGIGVGAGAMESRNAEAFVDECVDRIEAADYATSVVDACKSDADALGYDIEISIINAGKNNGYGHLTLKYNPSVPLIGSLGNKVITADIR